MSKAALTLPSSTLLAKFILTYATAEVFPHVWVTLLCSCPHAMKAYNTKSGTIQIAEMAEHLNPLNYARYLAKSVSHSSLCVIITNSVLPEGQIAYNG